MLDEKTTVSPVPESAAGSGPPEGSRENASRERTLRIIRMLSAVAVLLPMAVFGFLSLLDDDPKVSEIENRVLASPPKFSLASVADGTYAKDLDAYYSDTFPLRESLILAGREIRGWFYIPLEDSQVIVGGEFEMGEGEALPPEDYKPPERDVSPEPPATTPSPKASPSPPPTQEPSSKPTPSPTPEPQVDLNKGGYMIIGNRIMHLSYTSESCCRLYADMLNRLQEAAPERRVISLIAPNSFPFYAPGSQITDSLDQKAMIESLYSMYDGRIVGVDPFERLMEHKEEYLYLRTDHHWNGRGAYWAYTAFCDALGYTPTDIETLREVTYDNFTGSFYREIASYPAAKAAKDDPDTVEAFVPDVEYTAYAYNTSDMKGGWTVPMVNETLSEKNSNKYVCFTNGDQPLMHVSTGTKNGRSIAVVKESYGNAFVPWLLAHYEDIYVIDFRKFNQQNQPRLTLTDFAEANDIDDILILNYCYVPNTNVQYERMAKMMP